VRSCSYSSFSSCLSSRPEVFKAGCSIFGVTDLKLLLVEGHKFESRYLRKYFNSSNEPSASN
jgi:hypothetical protein